MEEMVCSISEVAENANSASVETQSTEQRNVALTISPNINQLNSELAETSQDINELASTSSRGASGITDRFTTARQT